MRSAITIEHDKLEEAIKKITFLEEKLTESVVCSEALDKELQVASKSIVVFCFFFFQLL